MYVAYMTHCIEHNIPYVCWGVFPRIRRREHVGLLKFDKFLSGEVPLLESYKEQLIILKNQGRF